MPRGRKPVPIEERFWKKVDKSGECWLWTGARTKNGYGMIIRRDQKTEYTHRLSYRWHFGDIPAGMFVCHSCDNPRCVNPEHLFLGSPQANVDDMMNKGRYRMPGTPSKTDAELIRDIWRSGEATVEQLAEMFRIGAIRVNRVINGLVGAA